MKIKLYYTLLLGLALGFSATLSQAAVTNFSTDVGTSIDNGLAYLDSLGAYNNPSSAGDAAGLVLLALLEKRENNDPDSLSQGYSMASVADQERMRETTAYILSRINITPFGLAYRDGGSLMALSLYTQTGGPDRGEHPDLPAGLPHDLIGGINTIVDRFESFQRDSGYWCYGLSFQTCDDSSTTQFAVSGLLAAKGLYSNPAFADAARLATINTMLASARNAYVANGIPGQASVPCGVLPNELGHGYNAGDTNSLQQTASGTWIMLAGGANINDVTVQGYLTWLRNRYGYPGNNNANGGPWSNSWAYYLWSSSKAYQFLEDSGIAPDPGNLGPADIGVLPPGDAPACAPRMVHLDPDTVPRVASFGAGGPGYYSDPEETPRVYFDYAWELLNLQSANGQYQNPPGQTNWNNFSRQAYALLVLQRSVGGGCLDSDGDGVCDVDDPCPEDPADLCQAQVCDMDTDGDIDIGDVRAILGLRGQTVPPADPIADQNGDGFITVNDARGCILQCTLPRCATP